MGGQRRRRPAGSIASVAPELRVERLILFHAACSEVTGDLVMREAGSDHRQADFPRSVGEEALSSRGKAFAARGITETWGHDNFLPA